jgi:hypothetical protein
MAYIATLKKNNTVIYPQTKSTAVYEDDGVTPIDDVVVKKSTAAADTNKMIKADGTKALVGESNIDLTTITAAPTPGDLLHTFTTPLSSTQNFTAPNAPCIITGKAVVLSNPGYACIYRGSQQSLSKLCCGIPYAEGQSNMQVAFEFFAKAGETFHIEVQNGQIENLTAYEVDWS